MSALDTAAVTIKRWRDRPDLFVREFFHATPDPWQDEALRAFPTTPRLALKAAKGPGKTTTLAWLAWNFLITREFPNIAATSISADNLRDNLWKEMAVWYGRAPSLQSDFTLQTERIFQKDHQNTWFMSARSWSKAADITQLGNTLAGLHSDYILALLDESGAMPVAIELSAEGILTSCKEGHIVQAGNTNMLDGALYHACVTHKHLWKVIVITGDPDDPMRSSRINIEWAREMIRSLGRDDPYVKVMILGEWPKASLNALLGPEDVERAIARKYQERDVAHAARILGVDVARFGDDASVIFPRQGLVAFNPKVMRGVDAIQGAGQVARTWADWNVDAVFIDDTGGYGAAWIDMLRTLNRQPIGIGFAQAAQDRRYYNRRAEMYFRMAQWVKEGGMLPNIPELVGELTQINYTFKGDALLVEPKDMIKARLGRSPDHADALCLTFAETVAPKAGTQHLAVKTEKAYDPYEQYYAPARR